MPPIPYLQSVSHALEQSIYVPAACYAGKDGEKFYQYTMLDEATRERFLYAYKEQSSWSTIDFVKRAIRYFGYTPAMIQTDNGSEFTHTSKTDRIHPFDVLCAQLNITHKLIRPRTPWHNGKVERSHRSDQERFYNHLRFYSYDDLQNQMKRYLQRSNQIPMPVLGWMSPVQKREALKAARFCWFRSGSAFPASAKSFYYTLNFFIFFSLTSLTNVQKFTFCIS